jgi:hypothetical protein
MREVLLETSWELEWAETKEGMREVPLEMNLELGSTLKTVNMLGSLMVKK